VPYFYPALTDPVTSLPIEYALLSTTPRQPPLPSTLSVLMFPSVSRLARYPGHTLLSASCARILSGVLHTPHSRVGVNIPFFILAPQVPLPPLVFVRSPGGLFIPKPLSVCRALFFLQAAGVNIPQTCEGSLCSSSDRVLFGMRPLRNTSPMTPPDLNPVFSSASSSFPSHFVTLVSNIHIGFS